MLNIWSLVQQGEGSMGRGEERVLKWASIPLLLDRPVPFLHILPG